MDAANFIFRHTRGPLYGYISERGLKELRLPQGDESDDGIYLLHSAGNVLLGKKLHALLDQYFRGVRIGFADIPLDLSAGTKFQRSVWEAARNIPWGATVGYGELARRMGKTAGAARAVGQALGANPVPILVPCHRVLAAGGRLGGFSGGLGWKEELLGLEGAWPAGNAGSGQ